MSLTIIATLTVQPGKEAAFEEAVRPLVAHVKTSEPGTLTYVLHRAAGKPGKFMFYEVYKDREALAAHVASPPMQHFTGAVGSCLVGQPDIEMYDALDGKR